MKNLKIIIPILVIIALLGNSSLLYWLKKKHESVLLKNTKTECETWLNYFEKTGLQFENDINYVLYSGDIIKIFDQNANSEVISNVKVFYTKYGAFINNLVIYDTHNNVFSLYRDKKGNFLTDIYVAHMQNPLFEREQFITNKGLYAYVVPIFRDNENVGNIYVNLDVTGFFDRIYKEFFHQEDQQIVVYRAADSIIYISDNFVLPAPIRAYSHTSLDIKKQKIKFFYQNDSFNFFAQAFNLIYFKKDDTTGYTYFPFAVAIVLFNLLLLLFVIFRYYFEAKMIEKEKLKLQESEEAFRQIIDLLPIGIIILDSGNRIQRINLAATKILMVDPIENLIGEDINRRFFMGKTLMLDQEYAAAFDTNHFLHYENDGKEVVIYKKDIPITLKGQELIVQSFIDVTPIEKSRKREITANMAKSEFLARMSHEIRTPMNGIIGMADALCNNKLNPEQSEQVTIIKKSAELLLNIINDILDISKIEAGKMVLEEIPFKLREEVQLCLDLFKVVGDEKGIALRSEFAEDLQDNLIGDPFRLRQVLINLIGNAIKFTSDGEIVVTTTKIEEYNNNLMLKFQVADTGIGIPKEKIGQIFSSFTQVDTSTTRKYGGTGLGTTISKQLVELMNGEIFVESPSGISKNPKFPGTRFTFTIELFSNERVDKNFNNNDITSFNQIKTLVIGEGKVEEKHIEETLTYFNIPVIQHNFTKSTFDFIKNAENEGLFKLLIIKDSNTFDGFKLVNRIKDLRLIEKYPIIMLSSNDKPGNYVKCRRNGIDHYVIFPYESSEIYNFICETFPALHLQEESYKFKVQQLKTEVKILVAEDNAINQKVAKTLFKNLGYEVDFANNGVETLEMQAKNSYDIIFMDIMMPEMDGIQATKELRERNYQLPIIAMTANIAKDEKTNAMSAGMNDYITKPVRVETVKKILNKHFSVEE